MSRYILAIDQSTSGTKVLLFDREGEVIKKATRSHQQYYPQAGWVEHDPIEIYEHIQQAILEVIQADGISSEDIAAISITNQRETVLIWDKISGKPVYPAIVWQCQRTASLCESLREKGAEALIVEKTGLMLDSYFSATKLSWIISQLDDEAKLLLEQGNLLAGTIDSWLIWKLTEGAVHATDYSNASRTSLYNIYELCWDEQLCGLFDVPIQLLPEVKSSDDIFGYTALLGFLGRGIPITGIIGDSQAALFGNLCLRPGMVKATYGTGTSLLMQTGSKAPKSTNGLVATIAWGRDGEICYALESIIRTSGDSLKWLRDDLGMFSDFDELMYWLEKTPNNEGVFLVPAFSGLGAPYWRSDARAAIIGMNRGTHKGHILRAALESIAFQIYDAVILLELETDLRVERLCVDGGVTKNAVLMQLQSDLLEAEISVSLTAELSAKGAFLMGGLGIGWWSSVEQFPEVSRVHYQPMMEDTQRNQLILGWHQAIEMILMKQ